MWTLLLAVALLTGSEGCRRHRMDRSRPSGQSAATAPDTSVRQPAMPADSGAMVTSAPVTTPSTTSAAAPKSPRPGIEEARANVAEVDFTFLTAKARVSFKSKDQDIDNATVNIRVKKDSLIWIAISKIGVEAARVLVNRDSITILDKINNEYTQYDFPGLSKRFNFDMNFELLQALIVGNLPLPKQPAQKIKNERDYLLLRQTEGKVLVENYIGEENRKLKKLMVVEQPTKNTLRLDYADFTALNNFLFPYTSLITLDYKSGADGQFYQTLLRIRHSKVELVDKNPGFPFSIPARYTRRP
ncbi:hypothetical protein BLX24_17560 [Arsenicibacter rosenii]|uniref:DUF4292 domain-containing protein n=1 Tax=Arsenicibacter rosenii TaxID=1750698 RepID=A0A1S2VGY3_9BACT|nr:hypothetical protein BLX24_17560 [Arsenicibacter rosenii]